jgi:hypothetical protein
MRSGIVVQMKWVSTQLSNIQVVPVEVSAAFVPEQDGQTRFQTAEYYRKPYKICNSSTGLGIELVLVDLQCC